MFTLNTPSQIVYRNKLLCKYLQVSFAHYTYCFFPPFHYKLATLQEKNLRARVHIYSLFLKIQFSIMTVELHFILTALC